VTAVQLLSGQAKTRIVRPLLFIDGGYYCTTYGSNRIGALGYGMPYTRGYRTMNILKLTRNELVSDLPSTYREQNDVKSMSNTKLIAAWKRYGTHAGSWDWDDVKITR